MHMTHEAGDLFDLEYLREEFDNWYKPKPEISEIQKARLGIGEFKWVKAGMVIHKHTLWLPKE